jgi:hypothetical protein
LAGQESLRAAAARDKDFVGVDIDGMAQLIQQMGGASSAISAWLRTNGALPPGVSRAGLHQASAVRTWVGGQSGMLTRRRNYAITHLGKGSGPDMPRVSAGGLGHTPRRTTSAGAGRHVGNFPDTHAAARAAASDVTAIRKAAEGHHAVPAEVWKHLAANADDPDYTSALYDRLGPAGTAGLVESARTDKDHLAALRTSLGVASHHLTMNEKWLREMLDAALRDGVRDDAVDVLAQAGLGHRAKVALGHLGLMEMVQAQTAGPPATTGSVRPAPPAEHDPSQHDPSRHLFPAPRPPHEAMIAPAADDPHAAAELYSRHSATLRQALDGAPRSATLTRLISHATAQTPSHAATGTPE